MQGLIETATEHGVARITLNRPDKRNALTREMLDQLYSSVEQFDASDDTRVLVLQSAGSVFCAGMDLAQMRDRASDPDGAQRWREDSESYHKVLLSLLKCRFPTIALAPGPAIAGGVGLVLACDIVIAADSAYFELPEPRRGIVAAMVMPLLLRRTSHARAGHMVLSAERIEAGRALAIGLCDEVVPPSECESTLRAVLQSVLASSPQALATTKRFLNSLDTAGTLEALERAIQVSAHARASADAREGLDAFLEKRKPAWTPPEGTL